MGIIRLPVWLWILAGSVVLMTILLFIWPTTPATAASKDKSNTPIRKQWQQQLANICTTNYIYHKSVATATKPTESQSFQGQLRHDSCICLVNNEKKITLQDELALAFQYSLDERAAKDEMEIHHKGDTIEGTRKAGSSYPLLQQTIVRRPNGTVIYVHSHVVKDNWLYHNSMEIKANFLEQGQLQTLNLSLSSQVPLMNYRFSSQISGKLEAKN
jgi:hypothetical protein